MSMQAASKRYFARPARVRLTASRRRLWTRQNAVACGLPLNNAWLWLLFLMVLPSIVVAEPAQPKLLRKVTLPNSLLTSAEVDQRKLNFGGDIRSGDLTGNGQVDFLVYRSAEGGIKPSFLGAFDVAGNVLWQRGRGGQQPVRPGSVTLYDIDGDGRDEVIHLCHVPTVEAPAGSFENVRIQVRDGATGELIRQAAPGELTSCRNDDPKWTDHPNWVHQRILIANLRGGERPQDFVVKVGSRLLAFDDRLAVLWTYQIDSQQQPYHPAYTPAVGDIDGDGRDEVFGGAFLLGPDGKPKWQRRPEPYTDSVAIAPWDKGRMRAIGSGSGTVYDMEGNVVASVGRRLVPHGQEVRVADFIADSPGPEMIVRSNGHQPEVVVANVEGEVLRRFRLNNSPNETGMDAVYWDGAERPALLYNGGALWQGDGRLFAELPDLPPAVGPERMGWYHAIPANVCGDAREDLILYNPWDSAIYIYTQEDADLKAFKGYQPGPRQYNARLMD